MKTKISRWGNSLALRIPIKLAASYHLEEGVDVEISEEEGGLKLRPLIRGNVSLEALLAEVTSENLHSEVDTGESQGKEIW
jgi:antitoxin MazE